MQPDESDKGQLKMKAVVTALGTMLMIVGPAHAQILSALDVKDKCLKDAYEPFCTGFIAASSLFLMDNCRMARKTGNFSGFMEAELEKVSVGDVLLEFLYRMNDEDFSSTIGWFPAHEVIAIVASEKWPCAQPPGLSERDSMNGLGLSLGE